MSIERLTEVVPPPASKGDWSAKAWAQIEAELGTSLPRDFRDFGRLYGSGCFLNYMAIEVPRASDNGAFFKVRISEICDGFRRAEREGYDFWPSPGGLLPFASTGNAEYLFWLPRGAPEDWPVLVWGRDSGFEVFDCGFTDFLVGLATGEIAPVDFSDELLPCEHPFEPTEL